MFSIIFSNRADIDSRRIIGKIIFMDNFVSFNIFSKHFPILELFRLGNKTAIISHRIHRVLNFIFIT